jgi:hypothetical protein
MKGLAKNFLETLQKFKEYWAPNSISYFVHYNHQLWRLYLKVRVLPWSYARGKYFGMMEEDWQLCQSFFSQDPVIGSELNASPIWFMRIPNIIFSKSWSSSYAYIYSNMFSKFSSSKVALSKAKAQQFLVLRVPPFKSQTFSFCVGMCLHYFSFFKFQFLVQLNFIWKHLTFFHLKKNTLLPPLRVDHASELVS